MRSGRSEKKILRELRKHPKITAKEWNERGFKPCSNTIKKLFGSWNEAKRKAGVPEEYIHPSTGRKKTISRDRIKELHSKGMSDLKIATKLKCHWYTVWKIRNKELKLPPNYRTPGTSEKEVRSAYEHLRTCTENCGVCEDSYHTLKRNSMTYLKIVDGWALEKFREIKYGRLGRRPLDTED